MTKKFFAAVLIGAAIFMTGCTDDAENFNETTPNSAQASPVAKTVPNFSAKNLNGETVTQEIFAAKKISVVNIWGTFCPPCIGEMPDLGDMARNMPADAQLIGIVCDAQDGSPQIQDAQKILRDANANFVNIVPDEQLNNFLSTVVSVPTTIFINSRGEVVGRAIVGADVEGYKNELAKLLK